MFKKKTESLAHQNTPLAVAGPSVPPLPELPPLPAATTKTAPRAYSTLSADLQFVGSISGPGGIQIDGTSKGDVRVGRLIVGETGALDGDVAADYVEVRGGRGQHHRQARQAGRHGGRASPGSRRVAAGLSHRTRPAYMINAHEPARRARVSTGRLPVSRR